jgi:predicted porin
MAYFKSITLYIASLHIGMLTIPSIITAQTVSNEQLVNEIAELRSMIESQQKLISELQQNNNKPATPKKLSGSLKQAITEEVAAAVNASSPASTLEFYGQFHASLDTLDDGTYLSGNSSRIGVRSEEALDSDLKLLWQIEASINLDEGSDSNFNLRDTYIGIAHDTYGSFLLGRMDSAFERLHRWTDFFDDQIGDSRNIVGFGSDSHGFDNREDNSIKYISPEMNGYTTMATFTTGEGDQNRSTFATNTAFRNAAGLMIAGGFELHDDALVSGDKMEFGMRLVASYQWERIKLAGIIEYLDNIGGVDGSDRASGGFGAAYAINTKNTIKAQFRHTNGVVKDASTIYALGLDHSIQENTKIYLAYAFTTNDSLAENGVTGGGHGETVTPQPGDDSQGLSVGVIHSW